MKEVLSCKELKKLSIEDIENLQNKRFQATVQFLLPHVPAYSKLFKEHSADFYSIKSVADWSIPLIKKSYFIRHPEEFIVKTDEKEVFGLHREFVRKISFWQNIKFLFKTIITFGNIQNELKDYYFPKMPFFSGGTEYGIPSQVFITQKEKENLLEIIKIAGNVLKKKYFKPPSIGMNLFPYGPHLGWHAAHMALDLVADINLSTAAGGAMPTERLVAIAKKIKPTVYLGMSEYFRNRFLELAVKEKAKLAQKLLFANGASKLYDGEREKIKAKAKKLGAVKTTVLDLYGASELKEALFPECSERSGFHEIAPLSNIVKCAEVFKANENYATDWEFKEDELGGYATVWNIDGAGTLLEGYLIGDIFERIEKTKCRHCGLNAKRIYNINRIRDVEAQLKVTGIVEEKVKGARIDLASIRSRLLKIPEIEECQVVLKTKPRSELIINIVPYKSSAMQKAKHALRFLEATPKINKTSLAKLTSEKMKFEGIKIEK